VYQKSTNQKGRSDSLFALRNITRKMHVVFILKSELHI